MRLSLVYVSRAETAHALDTKLAEFAAGPPRHVLADWVVDLSDRKLRAFPEQLFCFPHLRRLRLARNSGIGPVPPRIGELRTLEELDLS